MTLGILIIKFILKDKLSGKFHYYIWFLLIIRLILPFSIESSFSFLSIVPHYHKVNISNLAKEKAENIQISENNNIEDITLTENYKNEKSDIQELQNNFKSLPLVWLIGTATILLYIISINILLSLKIKRYSLCDNPDIIKILEQCKTQLKINSKVSIAYDEQLKSPMLFGLINPKILISPEIINKLTKEELKFIIIHELAHLKRRDLLINALGILLQAIYWFNPIILYAINRMKQDCEISCDATVLEILRPEENKKYAQTIINMMKVISEPYWLLGSISFASIYNKRRIIMITLFKKTSIKWTTVGVLSLLILTGCSSLTSPVSNNEKPIQKEVASSAESKSDEGTKTDSSTEADKTLAEPKEDSDRNNFLGYLNLLGLSKEKLITTLKEEPSKVDEGGLEFKKAGIRVWFDQNSKTVSQVFTQRKDININGVKIGDKVDAFKKAFGNPVSDNNGDMHFKYNETAFISVNYDTNTKETYAVYFLKENF